MAGKAGDVVINLTIRAGSFSQGIDKGIKQLKEMGGQALTTGGKVLQFQRKMESAGHTSVTNMQATSASLRLAEGGMNNLLRSAERFASIIPGVGDAAKAVFPAIGAIAIANIFFEGEERVRHLIQTINAMPKAIQDGFEAMHQHAQLANDELAVTNDKLDIEIAKLEGKPGNGLALALDEARVNTDKLVASVEQAQQAVEKLLKEQSPGFFGALLGKVSTANLAGTANAFHQQLTDIELRRQEAIERGDVAAADRAQKDYLAKLQAMKSAGDNAVASNPWEKRGFDPYSLLSLRPAFEPRDNAANRDVAIGMQREAADALRAAQLQQGSLDRTAKITAAKNQMDEFERGAEQLEMSGKGDAAHERSYWANKLATLHQGSDLNYAAVYKKVAELTKGASAEARAAQEKAAREQMEAFEHGAAELEMAGQGDVFHERAYWAAKLATLKEGSLNYNRVYAKVAEETKAMDEELRKSLHQHHESSGDSFFREQERQAAEEARRIAEIQQRGIEQQRRLAERGQLADVNIAFIHGEISRYQALVAEAQIHAAAFDAEIADVQRRLEEAEALGALPGMKEEIARLQQQLAQLKAQADEQRRQDQSAIYSQTPGGAFFDAFHQWAEQATDAAEQIRRAFEEAATGINDALARGLTDPARTGYERMQNLRNGLAGVGRNLANQGLNFALANVESHLPGPLGKLFGAKQKRPTGNKGDALHVIVDGMTSPGGPANATTAITSAASAAGIDLGPLNPILAGIGGPLAGIFRGGGSSAGKPDGSPGAPFSVRDVSGGGSGSAGGGMGLLGGLFNMGGSAGGDAGSGGAGDVLGGLLSGFLPGFAAGGPIAPDTGAFIVGERGPEILNIGSRSGHVTPNHQLRSYGGDSHYHSYSVDARGATDPAAVEAAVDRAMRRAVPIAASMGARMAHETKLRTPASNH